MSRLVFLLNDTSLRLVFFLLMMAVRVSVAWADPPPVARFVPPALTAGVFALQTPLPDGLAAQFVIEQDGVQYRCPQPTFDRSSCVPRPGLLAAWSGRMGSVPRHVEVELRAVVPVAAATDDAWIRALWGRADSRGARVYREAGMRIAEAQIQWGGREQDPVWTLTRYVERDGYVLHLSIQVTGAPDALQIALLRRCFVDGPRSPLGPAGASVPLASQTSVVRKGTVWPFHSWNRAVAVRFNEFPMREAIPLYACSERGLSPHIIEAIPISIPLAKRSVELVVQTRGAVAVSKCPFPRHAVILYDGDVPVASINVCFSCGDILVWPRWESVAEPDWDHLTHEKRRAYESALKEHMARYEKTFPFWKLYFRDQIGFPIDAKYH